MTYKHFRYLANHSHSEINHSVSGFRCSPPSSGRRGILIFSGILILACLLQACHQTPSGSHAATKQLSPGFNADSAMAYTARQVAFGPRIPGTQSHKACGAYLVDFFKKAGASVFVQGGNVTTYDGKTFELENIIASTGPAFKSRVMLSAHWDARPFSDQDPDIANKKKPFDAANDGGSGVAVLMEIARDIQLKSPGIGVDLVLWDVEDYGSSQDTTERTWCLGTQYWAKHPPVPGYAPLYCINLDMVGGQHAVFYMDKPSMAYAPHVVQKVWDIANELGYSSYFSYQHLTQDDVDDHVYVNKDANIPAIDIVDLNDVTGFYKYWHRQGDNMEHMDTKVLKAVGQTVLETVFREALPAATANN